MLQYTENVDAAFDAVGALDTADFIRRTARAGGFEGDGDDVMACARFNLRALRRPGPPRLALPEALVPDGSVQDAPPAELLRLHRGALPRRVSGRPAGAPLHGRGALRGLPGGRPHHPPGQPAAGGPGPGLRPPLREHLHPDPPRPAAGDPPDQAVHHGAGARPTTLARPDSALVARPDSAPPPADPATQARVAIIGAGPAGLAAAEWLAYAGLRVTIFEERPYAGGMVGGAIPTYRLPQAQLDQDLGDPRAPRRRDPLRPAGRRRLHARRPARRRVRGDLRRRGRPAGEDGSACRARMPGA